MTKKYEVGYGKPPKHSQFKPGQSGNTKGRKKGSKNLATIYKALADEKFPAEKNGKKVKLTRIEMMFIHALNSAAKGDPRASDFVERIMERIEMSELQKEKVLHSLNTDAKEILRSYIEEQMEDLKNEDK